MNATLQKLEQFGIVPVVVLDDAADAAPLAKALCDGGVISGEILSIITSTPMMVAVDVMIWVTLWFNPIPSVSTSFVILDNTSP